MHSSAYMHIHKIQIHQNLDNIPHLLLHGQLRLLHLDPVLPVILVADTLVIPPHLATSQQASTEGRVQSDEGGGGRRKKEEGEKDIRSHSRTFHRQHWPIGSNH